MEAAGVAVGTARRVGAGHGVVVGAQAPRRASRARRAGSGDTVRGGASYGTRPRLPSGRRPVWQWTASGRLAAGAEEAASPAEKSSVNLTSESDLCRRTRVGVAC